MGPSKVTSAERLMPQATVSLSCPPLTVVIWGEFIKQSLKLHSLTYIMAHIVPTSAFLVVLRFYLFSCHGESAHTSGRGAVGADSLSEQGKHTGAGGGGVQGGKGEGAYCRAPGS